MQKKTFLSRANGIFVIVGRLASEEVVIQLFKSKCLPIFYCAEARTLTKANINSFDFAVNRFFMKLLKTANIQTVKYCHNQFGFKLPTELIVNRTEKFNSKLRVCV